MKKKRRKFAKHKQNTHRRLTRIIRRQLLRQIFGVSKEEALFLAGYYPPITDTENFFGSDTGWCYAYYPLLADGYINAALSLLNFMELKKQDKLVANTYILPVLFCFRHYLEHTMKESIYHFGGKVEPRHNLLDLFHQLRQYIDYPQYDNHDSDNIERFIKEISDIDKNSMAFRYSDELNSATQHPRQEAQININLAVLRKHILQMYKFFDGIYSLSLEV